VTELIQYLVAGVAIGALYALVALGFVIIYKATGVINLAQGGLLLLGTYLAYAFRQELGLPFFLAVVLAMAACAGVALGVERVVLTRMVGRPVFAVIMVTIGLAIVIDQVVTWKWGFDRLDLADPWGLGTFRVGGVIVATTDVARIVAAGATLAGFFALFRWSRLGVAMRATASDQEAALAHGISPRLIFGVSWALAAAVATLAGVLLSAGARGVDPSLSVVALLALPAVILGGLDSPGGAVVGGVVIGVVEELAKGYGPSHLPAWVGDNPHTVLPYVVLVAVLLIRPHGLFGTKEVERL
jgi:branched-chain amino acid transport system permease protein